MQKVYFKSHLNNFLYTVIILAAKQIHVQHLFFTKVFSRVKISLKESGMGSTGAGGNWAVSCFFLHTQIVTVLKNQYM